MADADLRALERKHAAGDPEATERLVMAHERLGEVNARCRIVGHGFRPNGALWAEATNRTGFPGRHRWCTTCGEWVALYWVEDRNADDRRERMFDRLASALGNVHEFLRLGDELLSPEHPDEDSPTPAP